MDVLIPLLQIVHKERKGTRKWAKVCYSSTKTTKISELIGLDCLLILAVMEEIYDTVKYIMRKIFVSFRVISGLSPFSSSLVFFFAFYLFSLLSPPR